MAKIHTVKITVLKRLSTSDVYGAETPIKIIPDFQAKTIGLDGKVQIRNHFDDTCPRFEEGQEFLVDNYPYPPANFCGWAFHDIQRDITLLAFGGDVPWSAESGVTIACCTDGLRPVFFKLERID